jgi:immune inhibitor A
VPHANICPLAAAVGQTARASGGGQGSGPVRLAPSTGSYYNPVAPQLELAGGQERLGTLGQGAKATLAPSAKVIAQANAFDRKHAEGFPPAAKQLGMLEAKAAKSGKSPRAFKYAPSTQTARLLTVLVEFNPNANDDFSGLRAPGRHRLRGLRHRARGHAVERPAPQPDAQPGHGRPRHRQRVLLGAQLSAPVTTAS